MNYGPVAIPECPQCGSGRLRIETEEGEAFAGCKECHHSWFDVVVQRRQAPPLEPRKLDDGRDAPPMQDDTPHPMQPIVFDGKANTSQPFGVLRFKRNPIVDDLLSLGQGHGLGLDEIVRLVGDGYSQDDLDQLLQLSGYSVCGYNGSTISQELATSEADAVWIRWCGNGSGAGS